MIWMAFQRPSISRRRPLTPDEKPLSPNPRAESRWCSEIDLGTEREAPSPDELRSAQGLGCCSQSHSGRRKAASRSSITTGVLDARFVSTLRVAISTNPPSCCCRCIQAKTRCQPLSLASAFASLLSCMFFSLLSAFGRCLVTRKHGLHPAKPALQVALLECLQHSSGEITYGVRESGIYRPRKLVVDGIGE